MPGMRRKFKQVAAQLGPALPREDDLFWNHYANSAAEIDLVAIPIQIMKNDSVIFEAEFQALSAPRSLKFLAAAKTLEIFGGKQPKTDWDQISMDGIKVGREQALKVIYQNDIVRAAADVRPGVFAAIQRLRDDLVALKGVKPQDIRDAFDRVKNNFVAGIALSAYEVKVKSAFWRGIRQKLSPG